MVDFLRVKQEEEGSWRSFLEGVWRRGLRGAALELIPTDGHAGPIAALRLVWPQGAHQRCWARKLRNVEGHLKRSPSDCLRQAKGLYQARHRREARRRFRAWKARWEREAPRAVRCVEKDWEGLPAFYDQATEPWTRIRTRKVIERLFAEVRGRIGAMCAFTTRDSGERILCSVFQRMNRCWHRHPLKAFTQNN